MAPTITSYAASDYDDVWSLHQRTVNENDGFVKNLAFHTDLHDIPRTYEAFFVLHDDGPLIGMVGLKCVDINTLEVKRLQIAAGYQKRGFGRKLIEHTMDYARSRGISRLLLDVSEPQAKARNLYLSMGFKVTHTQARTLGPDNDKFLSTFMEKEL